MDERDLKNIYASFISLAILILIYGSSYSNILQIIKILTTTNILITNINISFSHMPFYIKLVIIILLIPMIIDIWNDMVNISKIAKTKDEELGEIILILTKVLIILGIILILITPYISHQLLISLNGTYINLTENNG